MNSFFNRFFKALPIAGLFFLTVGAASASSVASEVAVITYHDPDCTSFDLRRQGNTGPATLVCIKGDDNTDRPSCTLSLMTPAFLGKTGGVASLSAACSNANGVTRYVWTRTASDTGETESYYPGGTSLTNNAVPRNDGNEEVVYTYTFFACKGPDGASCSYPSSRTVTVLPTETVPVIDPPTGCTASGSTSSVPNSGGSVTLNGSCTGNTSGSTTYTWTRNPVGGNFPKTGASTSDSFSSNSGASITYNYTMTACNADKCATSNQVQVTHQGVTQPTAPTGCTVNPTTAYSFPNTGGQVSWTASCTGNATSATYSWTRSPSGGTYPNGTTLSENLPANSGTTAITYTYTMKACNGTACAADITRTATVAAGSGGGGTNMCGQLTNVITRALKWGDDITVPLGSGVLSASITVPAAVASGVLRISVTPTGGWVTQHYSFSENACDFNDRTLGNPGFDTSYQGQFSTGTNTTQKWRLTAGKTYHLNVRNRNAYGETTCTGTCNMRIQVYAP
ncbi:MAG: hypothetical protein FWC38_06445 [Proteobacteria bacterium]|nr:hypothetical protein [Pseudomonadota bacterium]MCL2307847.1 hypothetical protein [Pseudomonadota bacterium]